MTKRLLAAMAVTLLFLLGSVLWLVCGCESMPLLMLLLTGLCTSVCGSLLYFLYWVKE